MREILSSDKLPGPKFKYSQCVKVGPMYQFAGMIGLDRETGQLASGGPYEQTKRILQNLKNGLPDFGLTLHDHLFGATVFTSDFSKFADINKAWEEVFDDDLKPPARSAVGVSELPLGALVEIEFRFWKES